MREGGRKHKSEQEFCLLLVQGTCSKPPAPAKQEVKLNRDLPPYSCGGLFLLSCNSVAAVAQSNPLLQSFLFSLPMQVVDFFPVESSNVPEPTWVFCPPELMSSTWMTQTKTVEVK